MTAWRIGCRVVGDAAAHPEQLDIHPADTSTSTVDDASAFERFREDGTARLRVIEEVLKSDSRREAAGASDPEAIFAELDRYGPGLGVVAVHQCVGDGFANGAFWHAGNADPVQADHEFLLGVAHTDEFKESLGRAKER